MSVVHEKARFTALSPRVLRMEWGSFLDPPTIAFPFRSASYPSSHSIIDGALVLKVGDCIELTYKCNGDGRFSPDNLSVRHTMGLWHPGAVNKGNLGGPAKTNDKVSGRRQLSEPEFFKLHCQGVCSRDGWALLDDSSGVLEPHPLWPAGWVHARPASEAIDWYLFLHGHDYQGALADLARLSGAVPLIPRYTLGIWHSQWFPRNQEEWLEMVDEFASQGTPLSVFVEDMDFHDTADGKVPQAGHGWGGFQYEPRLFPHPELFVAEMHKKGVRYAVNIHPADGVPEHERHFQEFMQKRGEGTAAFAIWDAGWARAFVDVVLRDLLIDFPWIDYQGREETRAGVTPSLWLLHVMGMIRKPSSETKDSEDLRPMQLNRFGGLGSHRYPVHHSGDTFALWSVLRWLPSFTLASGNLLCGWLSHDIGGFFNPTGQKPDPELFVRWMQYAAVSPVFRTHCGKEGERRFWMMPPRYALAARTALRRRLSLVPSLYTWARQVHDTARPINCPMYLDWPTEEDAYLEDGQYLLGSLLACPVLEPATEDTGVAPRTIWIPPNTEWVETTWLLKLVGPQKLTLRCTLDDSPMFARAGSMFVTCPSSTPADALPSELSFHVFPPSLPAKQTRVPVLYEDDGLTESYRAANPAQCFFVADWERDADGDYSLSLHPPSVLPAVSPRPCTIRLVLHGLHPLARGCLLLSGEALPLDLSLRADNAPSDKAAPCFGYDAAALAVVVYCPCPVPAWGEQSLVLHCKLGRRNVDAALAAGLPGLLRRALVVKSVLDADRWTNRDGWPAALLHLATGRCRLQAASEHPSCLKDVDGPSRFEEEAGYLLQCASVVRDWLASSDKKHFQDAGVCMQLSGEIPTRPDPKPTPTILENHNANTKAKTSQCRQQ